MAIAGPLALDLRGDSVTDAPRGRGLIWPTLITVALLFTVGANVVMLFAATSDRNGSVVEPDYYQKAVDWDRTMARRAASDRLGWRVAAGIGADRVDLTLLDSLGAPISAAAIEVTLIHNRDAGHPVTLSLGALGDGRYGAAMPQLARGRWEVRVEARRGDDHFGATLHAEAP